ncbi:MAG TPA: pyridoxine 5'-phosphate synthase [Verrucomicrobiales bacterium]|jgi:pyridoxine 5-phosphate synthase|nr:pyridoxine 5'-phosphate synthase [Verrucomicrobiales bacterium]
MLKLGVNIDHITTLREARYRGLPNGEPDLQAAVRICEKAGAYGITAHLREDRRHIQDRDLKMLREVVSIRLNMEMANTEEMIRIALGLKPEIVCIVPENREEVTTEGGLNVVGQLSSIRETVNQMKEAGIETSLFIDPDPDQIQACADSGAEFIELHTGAFCERFKTGDFEGEFIRLQKAAIAAHEQGILVNAGHGLDYDNLKQIHEVPHLIELNIGHSIICRSIFTGLEKAVKEMLVLMQGYGD